MAKKEDAARAPEPFGALLEPRGDLLERRPVSILNVMNSVDGAGEGDTTGGCCSSSCRRWAAAPERR